MGVRLDSPNARPVVSDDTEPEIGIKRKKFNASNPTIYDGLFRKILLSVSSDNTPYRYKNPLDKYSKRLHLVYIERQLYIFTLIEVGLFRY